MLDILEAELNKRLEVFTALDLIIRERFVITPNPPKRTPKRLRRDVVHASIMGKQWAHGGNWRMKKLICEKLTSMGVGKLLSTGRRWYTGIEFKDAR
jgi:hypothetical protein